MLFSLHVISCHIMLHLRCDTMKDYVPQKLIWYHHHTKCFDYLFLRVETFHPHPPALLLAQQPENQSVWWWREFGRSWLVSYAQKTNNIYTVWIEWSHILPQLLPGVQCDCPGFSSLRIKVQAQHLQCGIAHLIYCKSNLFCGYLWQEANLGLLQMRNIQR